MKKKGASESWIRISGAIADQNSNIFKNVGKQVKKLNCSFQALTLDRSSGFDVFLQPFGHQKYIADYSVPPFAHFRRAVFSFNPQEEPLIGEAAVIAINDVRHELYPEFLQRTLPYFFTFDQIRRCYKWSNIAFIQV